MEKVKVKKLLVKNEDTRLLGLDSAPPPCDLSKPHNSVCFSLFICKMGRIVVIPISWAPQEDELKHVSFFTWCLAHCKSKPVRDPDALMVINAISWEKTPSYRSRN